MDWSADGRIGDVGTIHFASSVHRMDEICDDLELDHDEVHHRTRIFVHHDADRTHPASKRFRYPEIVSCVQRKHIQLLEA